MILHYVGLPPCILTEVYEKIGGIMILGVENQEGEEKGGGKAKFRCVTASGPPHTDVIQQGGRLRKITYLYKVLCTRSGACAHAASKPLPL